MTTLELNGTGLELDFQESITLPPNSSTVVAWRIRAQRNDMSDAELTELLRAGGEPCFTHTIQTWRMGQSTFPDGEASLCYPAEAAAKASAEARREEGRICIEWRGERNILHLLDSKAGCRHFCSMLFLAELEEERREGPCFLEVDGQELDISPRGLERHQGIVPLDEEGLAELQQVSIGGRTYGLLMWPVTGGGKEKLANFRTVLRSAATFPGAQEGLYLIFGLPQDEGSTVEMLLPYLRAAHEVCPIRGMFFAPLVQGGAGWQIRLPVRDETDEDAEREPREEEFDDEDGEEETDGETEEEEDFEEEEF